MKRQIIVPLVLSVIIIGNAFYSRAQIRDIPKEVETAFENQYPQAPEADFEDRLVNVWVYFKPGDQSPFADSLHTAKYTNKGVWQFTRIPMPYDRLPVEIKTGFNKSKYIDWQIDHVYKVELPAHQIRYKIQVEKGVFRKKNLYFEKNGRLIQDQITLY